MTTPGGGNQDLEFGKPYKSLFCENVSINNKAIAKE